MLDILNDTDDSEFEVATVRHLSANSSLRPKPPSLQCNIAPRLPTFVCPGSGSQFTLRNGAFERVEIRTPDPVFAPNLNAPLACFQIHGLGKLTPDTDTAVLTLGDQITFILRFFFSCNLRITCERAWNQTVQSQTKTPSSGSRMSRSEILHLW
jgi:hypothetical protein